MSKVLSTVARLGAKENDAQKVLVTAIYLGLVVVQNGLFIGVFILFLGL
jgi:hypothetical protein